MSRQNNSIQVFFQNRKYPTTWCKFPIILRWLNKESMKDSICVIDGKVQYLLSQPGGTSKVKEWFLSDDPHLITITAERYILDYLRELNPSLKDILVGNDVDASIEMTGNEYGIEVSCFLETISEWIVTERLQQCIEHNSTSMKFGLEVSANLLTLQKFSYLPKKDQCSIIENLCSSIGVKMPFTHKGFTISEASHLPAGAISWEFEQDDSNPFEDLLNDLENKLAAKSSQLGKRENNLLFICVGSMPTNWLFPNLFAEITKPFRWKDEIVELEKRVIDMIKGTTVKGVCFFVYSLDREKPYYPLKLITDDRNITIKL